MGYPDLIINLLIPIFTTFGIVIVYIGTKKHQVDDGTLDGHTVKYGFFWKNKRIIKFKSIIFHTSEKMMMPMILEKTTWDKIYFLGWVPAFFAIIFNSFIYYL